jgi:hypothetical protein
MSFLVGVIILSQMLCLNSIVVNTNSHTSQESKEYNRGISSFLVDRSKKQMSATGPYDNLFLFQ